MSFKIPTVNEQQYSWANIEVKLFGKTIMGLKKITFTAGRGKTPIYGAGDYPAAIQHGKRSYEGSITVTTNEFMALNLAVKAAGYADLLDVDVDIVVSFVDKLIVRCNVLKGVSFSSLPVTSAADVDSEITHELKFVCLHIDYDYSPI